jgi:hypothetical protein
MQAERSQLLFSTIVAEKKADVNRHLKNGGDVCDVP